MSNRSSGNVSFITLVYLAVLAALLYGFHTELFVASIRLYSSVVIDSPEADRLLGDYYQNNAHRSSDLSYDFYVKSMKKYKEKLANAPPPEEANIKFNIGRLYRCGKSVTPNPNEAKKWYEDALKATEGYNDFKKEELIKVIKEELAIADQSIKEGITPPCPYHLTDKEFFVDTFGSL